MADPTPSVTPPPSPSPTPRNSPTPSVTPMGYNTPSPTPVKLMRMVYQFYDSLSPYIFDIDYYNNNIYIAGKIEAVGIPGYNPQNFIRYDGVTFYRVGYTSAHPPTTYNVEVADEDNIYYSTIDTIYKTSINALWPSRITYPVANSSINDIAWDGTYLYAAGDFTSINGISSDYISRWDGAIWSPVGGGTNGPIEVLFWDDDNSLLYTGGSFTQSSGIYTNLLSVWDGSSWSEVGGGGIDVGTQVIAIDKDTNTGDIYVYGFFTNVGGENITNIARWDGNKWNNADPDSLLSTQHPYETIKYFQKNIMISNWRDFFQCSGGAVKDEILTNYTWFWTMEQWGDSLYLGGDSGALFRWGEATPTPTPTTTPTVTPTPEGYKTPTPTPTPHYEFNPFPTPYFPTPVPTAPMPTRTPYKITPTPAPTRTPGPPTPYLEPAWPSHTPSQQLGYIDDNENIWHSYGSLSNEVPVKIRVVREDDDIDIPRCYSVRVISGGETYTLYFDESTTELELYVGENGVLYSDMERSIRFSPVCGARGTIIWWR